MKKTNRLFTRLALPVLLALLLLPPLACVIFRHAAESGAYAKADSDLKALRQAVLPVMYGHFETPQATVRTFLRRLSPLERHAEGGARLLILESRLKAVYPYDEAEREAVAPLAEACAQQIRQGELLTEDTPHVLMDGMGERYLVRVELVPTLSEQIEYLIAYCPIASIGTWVERASMLVLVISAALALAVMGMVWFTSYGLSRSLTRLCRGADRIGTGDFQPIEPGFSVNELEWLRLAMNGMSDRLRRAEEGQRRFFQNVSHELRNPLMSIGGYAQGIEHGVFSEPAEAAHTILSESARLSELVDSLLTLSRLESEQAAPLCSVTVSEAVEAGLDRVRGAALRRGIAFEISSMDDGWRALGNADMIAKVLENLLTNAIRYARTAVRLHVETGEDHVCISVRDDGPGLSEKDLLHAFERCYKGEGGHFGIGLAIAQSAARRMGGTLTAANAAEGGAVFTLTLRRVWDNQKREAR